MIRAWSIMFPIEVLDMSVNVNKKIMKCDDRAFHDDCFPVPNVGNRKGKMIALLKKKIKKK